MKWAPEQIKELTDMCFQGIDNKALANHFGVPVVEIHAKRSQLGITMPKVAALKGKPAITVDPEFEAAIVEAEKAIPAKGNEEYNEERFAQMRVLEEKRKLVKLLEPAICFADEGIAGLDLIEKGETVLIRFKNGFGKRANVECDSLLAIIADVTHKCLY